MPEILSREFMVRNYECDANGHLYNTNYLRYIQELNFELLRAADDAKKGSPDSLRGWQPHQVFIDFQQPLRFGDRARVSARLVNTLHGQAIWSYEISSPAEAIHAQAKIIYHMFTRDRKFDAEIPFEILQRLNPYLIRVADYSAIDFPTPTVPPAGALGQLWDVNWRDIGGDGCLHLAAYFDYLLDFLMGALAERGWSYERELEAGFAWYVRRHWLEILAPVQLTDKLRLASWLSDVKRSTVLRNFTIHSSDTGDLLGRAYTLWMSVDPASGRPLRISERITQVLADQIVD